MNYGENVPELKDIQDVVHTSARLLYAGYPVEVYRVAYGKS